MVDRREWRGEMLDLVAGTEWDVAQEVIPRDHLAPGAEWPDGDLVVGAPPGARVGQLIAQALLRVMRQRSLGQRELARIAELAHPTVKSVLDGTRLPSVHSLVLLEQALQTSLYPHYFYRHPEQRDATGS